VTFIPFNQAFDCVVIGSGPAGTAAALRASVRGMRVCVIEHGRPGGVCVNEGCIPTKSLASAAETILHADKLARIGVVPPVETADFSAATASARKAAHVLSDAVVRQIERSGVAFVRDSVIAIDADGVVCNGGARIRGKFVLVATGSRAHNIQAVPVDHERVLYPADVFGLTALPCRIAVVGGGYIGCEFASIFGAFGAAVTVVERETSILPGMDGEMSGVLARALRERDIGIVTGATVESFRVTRAGAAELTYSSEGSPLGTLEADIVVVAVGRIPDRGGVSMGAGAIGGTDAITTGDGYRWLGQVFAAGDVVGDPMLAHAAAREAEIAVDAMSGLGREGKIDANLIPYTVFTEPQAAGFGPTETSLRITDRAWKKVVIPVRSNTFAVAADRLPGRLKLIFDPETRAVLACHAVGDGAVEIMHEVLVAAVSGIPLDGLARVVHAHPSLSELVQEAVRAALT